MREYITVRDRLTYLERRMDSIEEVLHRLGGHALKLLTIEQSEVDAEIKKIRHDVLKARMVKRRPKAKKK